MPSFKAVIVYEDPYSSCCCTRDKEILGVCELEDAEAFIDYILKEQRPYIDRENIVVEKEQYWEAP